MLCPGVKALDVISKNCLCFTPQRKCWLSFFCTGKLARKQRLGEHPRLTHRRMASVLLRVSSHLPKNLQKNGTHKPAI